MGRSCLANLLEFFEEVNSRIDKGEAVDVVSLDFLKCFDKVSLVRLLNEMGTHGIREKILAQDSRLAEWSK